MKNTIFIDLDGVLTDFTRPAFSLHGVEYEKYPVEAGWDIIAAFNTLAQHKKMSAARFWKAFDQRFWATLPKTTMCDALLCTVEEYVGAENVCILTSGLSPAAAAGKVEWIYHNLPKRYVKQSFIGHDKHFMAGIHCTLIDDRDKNVEDFSLHGGQSILVPRPWNTMHAVKYPESYVFEQLACRFKSRYQL